MVPVGRRTKTGSARPKESAVAKLSVPVIRFDGILLAVSVLFLFSLGTLMLKQTVRIYNPRGDNYEMGLVYLALPLVVGAAGACFHWMRRKPYCLYITSAIFYVPGVFFMHGNLGIATYVLIFGASSSSIGPGLPAGPFVVIILSALGYALAVATVIVATIRRDLRSGRLPAGSILFSLGVFLFLVGAILSVIGFMFSPPALPWMIMMGCFCAAAMLFSRAERQRKTQLANSGEGKE
jgi:hypothetical protein